MNAPTAGHDTAVQMVAWRIDDQDSCGRRCQWAASRLALTTGEAHDNRLVLTLLSALKSGAMLLADRGFDADWIRTFVSEHGAWANIPARRNRTDPICFSPHLYRARNLVFIGKRLVRSRSSGGDVVAILVSASRRLL